ncbi:L-threonylcarbamoyladenylate synthase [Aquipuribacter sp. SD81]|uniref:L-threonylcarbamoyladenylate synthase n=1 Tax=Aquipuribacter sp. SD81 TaxID=3127703 RepID=UPI0030181D54
MSRSYDCARPRERERGLAAAEAALGRGALVVVPTDTVYGVAADAFAPLAVDDLLAAKGSGRDAPPPVLVGDPTGLDALATQVPAWARDLAEAFWPGGLTLVLPAQPTLAWDLGDTGGRVALRMPLHPVALELLARTGPLAVSGANTVGSPVPRSAEDARDMLGDAVAVYLDGGACLDEPASSVVDATGATPRLLRAGAVPLALLREVVPDGWDDEEPDAEPDEGVQDPDAEDPDAHDPDVQHEDHDQPQPEEAAP